MSHVFADKAGYRVTLTFAAADFSPEAKDVLLFPFYRGDLVMVLHAQRGLELPGGKVEPGETPVQAAIREMREESGGALEALEQIGQYTVEHPERTIVKAIFRAEVSHFLPPPEGFETMGHALFPPTVNVDQAGFSPFVRDPVFALTMRRLREKKE